MAAAVGGGTREVMGRGGEALVAPVRTVGGSWTWRPRSRRGRSGLCPLRPGEGGRRVRKRSERGVWDEPFGPWLAVLCDSVMVSFVKAAFVFIFVPVLGWC